MERQIVHPKEGLQLRKIGRQNMIVEASAEHVNMSYVYSLNHTAAQLWERLTKGGFTAEELSEWLAGQYGIDPQVALRDVERQLAAWKEFGLIE